MSQQLNIDELELVVRLIDAVAARGAIKGDELLQVGLLRKRANEIIKDKKLSSELKPAETTAFPTVSP